MSSYHYNPLDPSKREIRLLILHAGSDELQGNLVHASLENKPIFEALSYTWGRPPFDRSLVIDGCKFPIGLNLESALRELWKNESSRTLWIDAICINQLDERERCQQVEIMQEIYISASRVLAWLGEAGEHGEQAISLLRQLQERDIANFRASKFTSPEWIALKSLWRRPYWKRIWIVQELAVGNGRALIGCGSQWISRLELENAMDLLLKHQNNPETLLWESIESEVDWLLNLRQTCRCDVHSWGGQHLRSLEDLLYLTEQYEATVPHDHFFALLGLSQKQDRLAISVDYEASFPEICGQVLNHIINSTMSLNILSGNRSQCAKDVSSWMPSFSDPVRRGYGWGSFRKFQAAGSTMASVELSPCGLILHCRGIQIGTVSGVEGPFENFESAFLNLEIVLRMRQMAMNTFHESKSNSLDESAFWETIFANRSSSNNISETCRELSRKLDDLSNFSVAREQDNTSDMAPHILQDKLGKYLAPHLSDMVSTLRFRSFFTSSSGHIGIGPHGVKLNDLVVVLFGSDVPFILRSYEDGTRYRLIGDAFVHGVMSGEIIQDFLMQNSRLICQQDFDLV